MSTARWPGLVPRQERSADSINGFADTFESIVSIDTGNLAEEGLDRDVLAAGVVGEHLGKVTDTTLRAVTAASGPTSAWAVWDPSGADPFEIALTLDDLADEDVILLEASISFASDSSSFGLQSNTGVRFRFSYDTSLATTNSPSDTGISVGTHDPTSQNGARSRAHGSVETFYMIRGSDLAATLLTMRLEYQTFRPSGAGGAVTFQTSRSIFTATRFRSI